MSGYDRINYMNYPMPWMNTDYSFNSPYMSWQNQGMNFYPSFQVGMYSTPNWDFNNIWSGFNTSYQPTFTSAPAVVQDDGSTAKLTDEQRKAIISESKEQLAEQNKKAHGGLVGAVAGGSLFAAGPVARGAHITRNQPVTEMFFTTESAKLWESHPTTMTEAQKVMQKSEKQYQKELAKLKKVHGKDKQALRAAEDALEENYKKYISNMEEAIKSGAEDVAQVTKHYKAGNGKWYKKAPKLTEKTSKYWDSVIKTGDEKLASSLANKSVPELAVKGNSFLRHMGGGIGIGMGLITGVFQYFSAEEKQKRQDAKKIAEETGDKKLYRKQVTQSVAKSFVPIIGWTLGEAGGRWLVDKTISKNAGKLAFNGTTKLSQWFTKKASAKVIGKACGKIASKLTGKAIGAAIGSIVPGLGTIIGLAVGAVADWALRKYVVPAIFGKNDAIDEKKIDMASNEELVTNAYISKINGEKISAEAEAAIASNPTFCAKLHEKILAEQQAQGYVA